MKLFWNSRSKKHNNRGFTLLEVVIASTLVVAFLGIGVTAVTGYQKSADTVKRDSIARTSFFAIQDFLTTKASAGTLDQFIDGDEDLGIDGLSSKKIDYATMESILDKNGRDEEYITSYKENHQDEDIVSVVISNNYPTNKELLLPAIEDSLLAEGELSDYAFLIELNRETGVVQAVFVSAKTDDFNYDVVNKENSSNVIVRLKEALSKKQQSYYGVSYTAAKLGSKIVDANIDPGLYECDTEGNILYEGDAPKYKTNYEGEAFTWRNLEYYGYLKTSISNDELRVYTGAVFSGNEDKLEGLLVLPETAAGFWRSNPIITGTTTHKNGSVTVTMVDLDHGTWITVK